GANSRDKQWKKQWMSFRAFPAPTLFEAGIASTSIEVKRNFSSGYCHYHVLVDKSENFKPTMEDKLMKWALIIWKNTNKPNRIISSVLGAINFIMPSLTCGPKSRGKWVDHIIITRCQEHLEDEVHRAQQVAFIASDMWELCSVLLTLFLNLYLRMSSTLQKVAFLKIVLTEQLVNTKS
ncbi:7810_t:CDS:2, partial [Paraglomus occultum]